MQLIRTFAIGAALAATAFAQDRLTLNNGDTLSGKIRMLGGNVVVSSPLLGDTSVALGDVENLVTEDEVELRTVSGETFKRRINGIEDASFKLAGNPSLPIDSLSAINPPQAEPPKWVGTVSVNGLWVDGNTRRRQIGMAGEAVRKTDQDRITGDASWDYAEDKPADSSDWNLTQRRAGAGLKYDYFLSERWYALATTRVLGDTFADLSLRFTAGAGIGYTVIENDRTTFLVEAGLSYFNEDYISAVPSKDYMAARVAYKLTHAFTEKTRLNHGVEAYPSLEDEEDVYLQMKTEVVTSLTESMIASLGWIMDYDNTPSPGLKRTDHRVLLSIGWSF